MWNLGEKDKELEKLLNKSTVLGLEVTEHDTKCGHKYYIIKIANNTHTVLIPSTVRLMEHQMGNGIKYTRPIKMLRGSVSVIGGEGLIGLDNVFGSCEFNILDLSKLNPSGYISLNGTFEHSEIDKIIFSENTWKVTSLTKTFERGTFGDLDLNNWNVNSVTALEWTFSKTKANNIYINAWNFKNIRLLYYTFEKLEIDKLDLSNLRLIDKITQNIFNKHKIKNLILNEDDKQRFDHGGWL